MANLKAKLSTGTLKGKASGIPALDKTLTVEGKAADAKAVGDKIEDILAHDYIIETGEDIARGYTYHKWKSGKVEAYGTKVIPLIFNRKLTYSSTTDSTTLDPNKSILTRWKGIPKYAGDMTDTSNGADNTFVSFPKDSNDNPIFKSVKYGNINVVKYSSGEVFTLHFLGMALERYGFAFFVSSDIGSASNTTESNVQFYFHVIGSWKE